MHATFLRGPMVVSKKGSFKFISRLPCVEGSISLKCQSILTKQEEKAVYFSLQVRQNRCQKLMNRPGQRLCCYGHNIMIIHVQWNLTIKAGADPGFKKRGGPIYLM